MRTIKETIAIIGWSCPEYEQDEEGLWPYTGEYEFTAGLPEGYVCEPPVSVTVMLGGAAAYTLNDRFIVEGLRYKELGPDTVQLMGYDGEKPEGTLIIPDTVIKPANGREYKVTRIGVDAFKDCAGLTGELIIPDTVIEIEDKAFVGCNFTGALILPDSLIKIGEYVFFDSGFTGELHLPEKLARIGASAFSKTGFTGRLILPEELTFIGSNAFYDCEFTGDLLIPDSVRRLGQGVFQRTKFTGKLTLSKELTEIEREVFSGCGFTGELTIPDTITRIGQNAFEYCNFTGELVLPAGITSIGAWVFYECSGLTGRLRIPDGLTECGLWAFEGTNIEAFDTTKQAAADLIYRSDVPKDKIMVGNQPYQPSTDKNFRYKDMEYEILGGDSVKLTKYQGNPNEDVFIPDMVTDSFGKSYFVTYIGERAFYNKAITGSLRLPDTLVCIEKWAFSFNGFEGRLSLPDTLTYIEDYAFFSSGFTGDLSIPENVSYIGTDAFSQTGFTGDLIIEGKLTDIENGVFFDSGFTGDLTFPDTLTSIGANAFYGCRFTGSLSLPEGLEIIGSQAFYDCSSFSGALKLPEPVTEIGDSAFYGCNGFDSAHVGSNLQKLGQRAFPKSLLLSTDSPQVQLLINTYLNQDAIADASWDGKEDVPAGAIASVKQDTVVTGDKRIGVEAVITVPDGIALNVDGKLTVDEKLTVDGSLVVDGTIFVKDTLVINGSLSSSGVIVIGKSSKVEGNLSGIRVEYQEDRDDLLEAKKLIESHTYTLEQGNAASEEAVQNWLLETIKGIPGLSDTGSVIGEVKITGFTPATEGTSGFPNGLDGSFSFTLLLSKGNSKGSAVGAGTITARGYISSRRSSGRDRGSATINHDILRGTWERMENGIWKFRQSTGIYAAGRWGIVDNLWYYFDMEGRMLTGWQFINNQWYYLCTEEDTKTKAGLKEGAMAAGWKEIDGKRYYFNPESDGTRGALQKEEPL